MKTNLRLLLLKKNTIDKSKEPTDNNSKAESLDFSVHLSFPRSELANELQQLIVNVHMICFEKKKLNSQLCCTKQIDDFHQRTKYQARITPMFAVITLKTVTVNNKPFTIPKFLNCKSRCVTYIWLYILSSGKEEYFECTSLECRDRTCRHRTFFDETKWESSHYVASTHVKKK